MPTFFQHFSIAVVDSDYLTSRDESFLQLEGRWLQSQGLEVYVDATPAINLFPGLRLTTDAIGLHNTTIATLTSLLHKMPLLGSAHLIVSLHAFSDSRNQSEAEFNATLHNVTGLASLLNVTVHMLDARKNPLELLPMSRFLDSCLLPSMQFALNLARLVNYGQSYKYDTIVQSRSSLLYLSAPAWDQFGIGYAVNLPLSQANSTGRQQVEETLQHVCSLRTCPYESSHTHIWKKSPAPSQPATYPLILDAVYENTDQMFADISFLETFLLHPQT